MRYLSGTVALCACAHVVTAQTSETLNLVDGGFRYSLNQIMPLPGQLSPRLFQQGGRDLPGQTLTGFAPHAIGDSTQWSSEQERQSLSQQWWYYRTNGDTREYGLSNQSSYTQVGGDAAQIVYDEPSDNGAVANALRFTLNYRLDGHIAQTSAVMTADWTIENTSGQTQNVEFFCYADPNAGGTAAFGSPADQWGYNSFATHSEFLANDAIDIHDVFMTFGALGSVEEQNDRWGSANNGGVGSTFSSSKYADNFADMLPNVNSTSSPLTTTNRGFAGGLQWSVVIPAGGSVSGTVYMGYNATVPAPGGAALLLGGGILAVRRRR